MDFVIGRNATIPELMEEEGYDAVFIGTGAGLPAFLGIPGKTWSVFTVRTNTSPVPT